MPRCARPIYTPTHICAIAIAFLLASHSAAETPVSLDTQEVEQRIEQDLRYLASDEREGRGPYSDGLAEAARYIGETFAEAGLQTKLINERPLQTVLSRARREPGQSAARLTIDGKPRQVPSSDFRVLSPSRTGAFDLPVSFVGYGISSQQDQYDDYAGIDVQGQALMMLRHEPDTAGTTVRFAGPRNSQHAYLSTKIQLAADRGAAAVLLVSDQSAITDGDLDSQWLPFKIRMPRDADPEIIVLQISRTLADELLLRQQTSLDEWETTTDRKLKPNSFSLDQVRISGDVQIRSADLVQQNVLGVVPGAGELASEVVVVGAHYDHLGFGGSGSLAPWTNEVHNGADDNASGTVALLETARQWMRTKPGARRTVLFIAFAAEEQGLIGSEYYVRHPLFALEKTTAMLNFDMVGRLRQNRLTVYGYNTAQEFGGWLDQASAQAGLEIKRVPGGYGPSDHASFYGRGVPVLHYFSGFHSDYHRPSDDIERVNIAGIRQIVQLNLAILHKAATEPITAVPGARGSLMDLWAGSALQSNSNSKDAREAAQRRTLGIQIDDVEGEPGVLIRRVIPGSIAQEAGMLEGDIVRSWNQTELSNKEDLIRAVQQAEPRQPIQLELKRGSLLISLEVVFPDTP